MPAVEFNGGQVAGWLEDAQGRLNVNRLASTDPVQRQLALEQFQRLCRVLNVDCPFWPAVADWLDADDEPMSQGAETATYLSMQPARRAANQPIVSLDELHSVIGVVPEVLEQLRPYLVALPQEVPVNVNTASLPVLLSMAEWMSEDKAKEIQKRQQQQPFESLSQVSQLIRQGSVQDAQINAIVNERYLALATKFFILHAQTNYAGHQWQSGGLLQREGGRVKLLYRWLEG
jgi:general secretion pathway protein K